MSVKNYINSFGEDINTLKKKIAESKDITETFLNITKDVQEEDKIKMFDNMLEVMCEAIGSGFEAESEGSEEKPFMKKQKNAFNIYNKQDDYNKEEVENDPLTDKPDLTSAEQKLIDVIVKVFDGYNYSTKYTHGNGTVILKQTPTGDFIKKWAEMFPDNNFEGIKMNIEVKI